MWGIFNEGIHQPEGVSDLERPASACLREVGSCLGDTHGMVLSDGPRLGPLRWDSGCRKDQGLTEKMARDGTNSRLRYTRATPLTRSLKAALTHKEPFCPQARQRGLQEKKKDKDLQNKVQSQPKCASQLYHP